MFKREAPIEEILRKNGVKYSILSNKEGYEIHRGWLELFAREVKEKTGSYTINGFVWEAYWSGVLPSLDGDAAFEQYQSKNREEFFLIHENGRVVFSCEECDWPNMFSIEAIVLPKSKEWSMVFSHENTMHYVEP